MKKTYACQGVIAANPSFLEDSKFLSSEAQCEVTRALLGVNAIYLPAFCFRGEEEGTPTAHSATKDHKYRESVSPSEPQRGTFKGTKAATESGGDNLVGLSRMTAAANEGVKIPVVSSKMVSCEGILEISLAWVSEGTLRDC